MNKIRLFAISLLLVFSLPASAGVVDTPDVSFGGQTYRTFQDDTTSLYWLDLDNFWDETSTYNSLIALLNGSGFHLATLTELTALQASIPAVPANFATEVVIIGGNNTTRQIMWGIYEDGNPTDGISYTFRNPGSTEWHSGINQTTATTILSTVNPVYNDLGAWIVEGDVQPTTYSVGGNVSGLTGSVTLQNNGGDDIIKTTNDGFTFPAQADSSVYAVTVSSQPTGQTCEVTNDSGTIAAADVTNVVVTCVTDVVPTYSVGGNVSGLTGSVTLQNNGGDDIIKTTNDGFTFPAQADSSVYAVTVSSQPTGQTCSVTGGSGTIATADVTNVAVTCVTDVIPTYSVGGTVSGLTGTGLALQNNGGDTLAVAAAATAFTFGTELLDLAAYAVTVSTQPTGQTCSVTNGSGAIAAADVTDVAVDCVDDVPTPAMPVPTLSQWALIMLSMLLGLMVFANRRRLF